MSRLFPSGVQYLKEVMFYTIERKIWRARVVPAQILAANNWTIRSDAPNIGDNRKPLSVEIHTN